MADRGRSLDSGRRNSSARLEIPSMDQRSDFQSAESKGGRRRWPFGFGYRALDLKLNRRGLVLIFTIVLALTGCDLFDPAKTDEPVFGPAPPRKLLAGGRVPAGPVTPPSQTAENTQTTIDPWSSPESSGTMQASSTSTRGTAPSDEIKRTSFAGRGAARNKMSGDEVVALVNGQPIFASEIFERSFTERLSDDGLSLLIAKQNLPSGRVTEAEYRNLQDLAIKKYLKEYIRTRILAQGIVEKLEKEQKEKIEEAIGKMFDEYVDRLKKDLKVNTRPELDAKMHQQGTSLANLKVEFRYRLLADEYMRQKSKKPHVIGRQEILAYYKAHLDDYSYPEKALAMLEKAVDALRHGEDFGKVAKKYSDGPWAEKGGQQSWTKPDSVADRKTAALLHELAPGEVSHVVHTQEAYRLIRINERKPAGRSTLAEVQETIKQKLEQQLQREAIKEVLVDVYRHASIESSYLTPEELGPPIDSIPAVPASSPDTNPNTNNRTNSSRNRRDRS
jgi:peptidyl-prolyl cis-trans isomerase SurA